MSSSKEKKQAEEHLGTSGCYFFFYLFVLCLLMEDICKLRNTKNKQINFNGKQLMKLSAKSIGLCTNAKGFIYKTLIVVTNTNEPFFDLISPEIIEE